MSDAILVDFRRDRWSPATQQSYINSWNDFVRWCGLRAANPLPAEPKTIADFLTDRAKTVSMSTISGRKAAIVAAHKLAKAEATKPKDKQRYTLEMDHPLIKDAYSLATREKGTAGKPKLALPAEDMRKIIRAMPAGKLQDRAVMLICFGACLRRSEVVALDVDDIDRTDPTVIVLNIRHSKTDKAGRGEHVAIARSDTDCCPVTALDNWLKHAGITQGPIFRGHGERRMDPRTVANITKRHAGRCGYPVSDIGAHSLRRGGVTTMHDAGVDMKRGMEVSRHKTPSVYLGYVQKKQAADNPAIQALRI